MSIPTTGLLRVTDMRIIDANVVHTTLDETIQGNKTFSNTVNFTGSILKNGSSMVSNSTLFSITPSILAVTSSYSQIPLGTMFTISPSNFFMNIDSNDKLNFIVNGTYHITYEINYTVDDSSINLISLSHDNSTVFKEKLTNSTGTYYEFTFSKIYEITSNPFELTLYVKSDLNSFNLTIESINMTIMKID